MITPTFTCNPCCIPLDHGVKIGAIINAIIYSALTIGGIIWACNSYYYYDPADTLWIWLGVLICIAHLTLFILVICSAQKRNYRLCWVSFMTLFVFQIIFLLAGIIVGMMSGGTGIGYFPIPVSGYVGVVFLKWVYEIYYIGVLYAFCRDLKRFQSGMGYGGLSQPSTFYSTAAGPAPATPSYLQQHPSYAANQPQQPTDDAAYYATQQQTAAALPLEEIPTFNPCCCSLEQGTISFALTFAIIHALFILGGIISLIRYWRFFSLYSDAGENTLYCVGFLIVILHMICYILVAINAKKRNYGPCWCSLVTLLILQIIIVFSAVGVATSVRRGGGYYENEGVLINAYFTVGFVMWIFQMYSLGELYAFCMELKRLQGGTVSDPSTFYNTAAGPDPATQSYLEAHPSYAAYQPQQTDYDATATQQQV